MYTNCLHVQVTEVEVTFQKFSGNIVNIMRSFVDTYSTVGPALYNHNPYTVLVGVAFLTSHEGVTTPYPLDL